MIARLPALALALLALAGPAPAPDAKVELRPLWGPHYRPGRILPVRVEIRAGAAPLAGEARADADGGTSARFAADTPAGGRRARVLPIVAHGAAPRCRVHVPGVAPAECAWTRPPRGVALVGFVAGDEDPTHPALALLPAPTRAVATGDGPALPDHPAWFDVLDCCVVGRLRDAAVSDAGAAALAAWLRGGGALLLTDPDVLRRAPALDAALFGRRTADEEIAATISGLPAHFATALRARGLGPRDVVHDAAHRPHHVRFSAGAGRGALLLSPLDTAEARHAYGALLAHLAGTGEESVPTLAPRVVGSFPPAAPSGWPRFALAAWVALVPLLAWWRPTGRGAWPLAAGGATLVAAALAVGALRPLVVLAPRVEAAGTARWLLHAAAPRAAALEIVLGAGAVARPLVGRLAETATATEWDDDARALRPALARGARAAWEVLEPAADAPALSGRLLGGRLVVANETGRALPACLLAWDGGLQECGPLAAAAVASVDVPARAPGPLAALEGVRRAAGSGAATALHLAWLRADPRVPTLLALDPDRRLAAPRVRGAAVARLPAVLVVPLPNGR